MNTQMRRLLAAVLVAAAVGWLGADTHVRAAGPTPVPLEVGPVKAVPDAAALDAMVLDRAGGVRRAAASAPRQDVLTEIDFEDEDFPPEGWTTVDLGVEQGEDPRYVWDRETCNVPNGGGDAVGWAVGGGPQGGALECQAAYSDAVSSALVFGPVDTTDYPDGVRVVVIISLDQPTTDNFGICATQVDGDPLCRGIDAEETNGWGTVVEPGSEDPGIILDFAGGQEDARVFFLYQDEAPTGEDWGAMIDNVRLEGVGQAEPPTATASPEPTATTVPPTDEPRQPEIFLPLTLNGATTDDLPPPPTAEPPPAWSIDIAFGLDVGPDGHVTDTGEVFQFGITQLCAETGWTGLDDGQTVRWQWTRDGNVLDIAALNGELTVGPAAPDWVTQCVINGTQENPRPLPTGTFGVQVFVDDAETPSAEHEVTIQEEPPPGATAIPTPSAQCEQTLANPGFDDGPAVWELRTNVQPPDDELSRVIRESGDPVDAVEGDYLAVMGGATDVVDQLWQPATEGDLLDATEIYSASLRFYAAYITDETPGDGEADDTFLAAFVNAEDEQDVDGALLYSEETTDIDPETWYEFTIDVTEQLTRRPDDGWNRASLVFESANSDADRTIHVLDEVRLAVCRQAGGGLQRAANAPTQRPVAPVTVRAVPERPFALRVRDDVLRRLPLADALGR